jgi:IS5 family transposase
MFRKYERRQPDFVSATAGDTERGALLRQADGLVDVEALRPLLGEPYAEAELGGKPGYDPVLRFKLLLLERWFNLSDRDVVKETEDRLSFLQFLGVAPGAGRPADNTPVDFRARLELAGGLARVFDAVNDQLAARGLVLRQGAIKVVDATLIAKQTWPGREDKEGKPLEPEAGYARRKSKTHFGYKAHISLDTRTELIDQVEAWRTKHTIARPTPDTWPGTASSPASSIAPAAIAS